MAITVATALTRMRAMLRDSSTAPGFLDADGMVFLNIAHLWWHENMERKSTTYSTGSNFPFVGGGTTWTQGTYYDDIEFTSDAAELIEVGLDAASSGLTSGQSIILERLPWSEIRMRQNSDSTQAQPVYWGALKLNGSYRWRLALYPLANYAITVSSTKWGVGGTVRHQPAVLTATTNNIDLGDSETDAMITIAAALMAPRMGRPGLGAHLWTVLPKVVQDKMETTKVHDEVNA